MEVDYPTQVYVNSLPQTSYFWLNTRVPPFSSLAVRRAVNFALDRHVLLSGEAADEGTVGAITCQVLPPDFPSYQRYCPYTTDPSADGNWIGPDISTARTLIARSGMKGVRVTILSSSGFGATSQQVDVFASTLRNLGFAVRIENISSFNMFREVLNDPGTRVQAGSLGWTSDYIAASNFFEPLLTCDAYDPTSYLNLNPGDFCDPAIDKEINQALAVQESNSGISVTDWTKIDRAVVDKAPWVSIANSETIDFVSRRIGDYQYNPQFGELTDLLWVR